MLSEIAVGLLQATSIFLATGGLVFIFFKVVDVLSETLK